MDLKKTTTTANSIVVASVICGLYQVAHLVPPPNPIWAANVLTYHPIWIQAAFFILSLILLVPFLRSLGLTYFGKLAKVIDPWGRSPWHYAVCVAWMAGASACFMYWGSAVHLLGDGNLFVEKFEVRDWQLKKLTLRHPLSFRFIEWIYELGIR